MFTLQSFYKSNEWEALRRQILLTRVNEQGELLCEHCGNPISQKYDAICHHKQELTEANVNNFTISLSEDNIAVVHHRCHNRIHDRWGSYTRHIYIVWGSPCAGKSSYVKENAGRHDIIVDVDEIYACISNNVMHDKSNRLTGNVLQIRDALLDMIQTRNGKWISAWVITSKCIPNELERLAIRLNGELVHIDTDEATCLARAEHREYGDFKKYVADYFRDYNRFKPLLDQMER